jgi:hypothetical protein
VLKHAWSLVTKRYEYQSVYGKDYQEALDVVDEIIASVLSQYQERMQAYMPIDWLKQIQQKFEYRVGYDRKDIDASYILDEVAKTILREYRVTTKDRRIDDRRTADRRKTSQSPTARPEESVAPALRLSEGQVRVKRAS